MITLDLQVEEKYKAAFEHREKLVVCNDYSGKARDTLLLWLWSRQGSRAWVSDSPQAAKNRLQELLALYPKIYYTIEQVKFIKFKDYVVSDYAVVEESESFYNADVSTIQERRILEQHREAIVKADFNGVTFDEQLSLLRRLRAGENVGYEENDLVNSITTESLYEFVKEFWSVLIPETFVDNWHIKYLCDEIQVVYERMFNNELKQDLVINISPGESKSSIASVFASAWAWKRMPSMRFIGGSYKHTLAADLSRKTRDVITSAKYQRHNPLSLRDDQNAKDYFVNDHGGMRLAIGTGGIAGFHGHIITIDDPLDPNKAASEIELKAANEWICSSLAQRKVDQARTPTILIMQRLHQNDPTAALLKRTQMSGGATVKHICLPVEDCEDVKPAELRKFYVDGLMDPKRLSHKTLEEKKTQGKFFYSGQYMQRPTPLEGGMFKWERIRIDHSPTHLKEWVKIVRYWDKAGSEGAGCRTAGIKMGLDIHGRFWILDAVIGQWDSGRREQVIKTVTQTDGHGVEVWIEQEPGSGGKQSADETIRMLAGFIVRADKPTGAKELRADPFSVQVNNGNVYMIQAAWNVDYLDELQYFPYSSYKDQVDASSGAFKALTQVDRRVSRF